MLNTGSDEDAQNRMTFEGSPPPRMADALDGMPSVVLGVAPLPAALWPQGVRPWARPRDSKRGPLTTP